jgi:hypothetical protein
MWAQGIETSSNDEGDHRKLQGNPRRGCPQRLARESLAFTLSAKQAVGPGNRNIVSRFQQA